MKQQLSLVKEVLMIQNKDLDIVLREKLRDYMKAKSLSQSDVARELGISRASTSILLIDKARYKIPDMLHKLADLLGYEIKLVKREEL